MVRFFRILAGAFIAVSCGINLTFGLSLAESMGYALLWGAISLAFDAGKCSLGIGIRSAYDAQRYVLVALLTVLLAVCATYGTLSAWAFADTHGASAAATYEQPKAQREALAASIADAKAQLSALPPASADIGALRAEAAAILADTRNNACETLDGKHSRGNCPRYFEIAPILEAEARRAELASKVESQTALLASLPIPVETDSRPRIIADIGAQAGITIDGILALSLLTVLTLELGCIVLPMLAWPPKSPSEPVQAVLPVAAPVAAPQPVASPSEPPKRKRGRPPKAPTAGVRVTQRELAKQTGKSLAQVNRELKAADASGEISLQTGPAGSVVQFLAKK